MEQLELFPLELWTRIECDFLYNGNHDKEHLRDFRVSTYNIAQGNTLSFGLPSGKKYVYKLSHVEE